MVGLGLLRCISSHKHAQYTFTLHLRLNTHSPPPPGYKCYRVTFKNKKKIGSLIQQ